MIDSRNEDLMTLAAAARTLPGRKGRGINPSTLWRWHVRGIRGQRLETLMVGGTRYTSAQAIQRFFERATSAADGQSVPAATAAQRRRAMQAAEQELIAAGL
jgi:uncharacterized protein DUF1580